MISILTLNNSTVVHYYTPHLAPAINGCYYLPEYDVLIPVQLCTVTAVATAPSDLIPSKYCYTKEKGFYLNPSYVEPQPEEPVQGLSTEISAEIKDAVVDEIMEGVLSNADTETT